MITRNNIKAGIRFIKYDDEYMLISNTITLKIPKDLEVEYVIGNANIILIDLITDFEMIKLISGENNMFKVLKLLNTIK